MGTEFKSIFRDLFYGSVNQAEALTENYSDEYASDVFTEAWERAE